MTTDAQFKAEDRALRELLASGVEQKLRALPGVVHVSIGLKETARRLVTDQLCIRVYVRDKKPLDELAPEQRVPTKVAGVPTDVNVVPELGFQMDSTRHRPIKGGIQITNRIFNATAGNTPHIIAGTLGCIAIDNTNGNEVLLSNWHVLEANTGGEGSKIYQPAPSALSPAAVMPSFPGDNDDKIAVVGRTVITDKVDAGIARIDVSSCCHCCGIHYSNEINGLSFANRPPRNTLVGQEAATAGMTVFKVGAGTLRTEGRVVDANFAPFAIHYAGAPYVFTGQIAIQNIHTDVQFSDVGDSGAVVVNLENKVVGLVFGAGWNMPGAPQPYVTVANHIADVLSALNIRIPFSSEVSVTAGRPLSDIPARVSEASIPEPYRALRERLQAHERAAALFALGQRHAVEITELVNHCRPVTVAWYRSQGPALLATLMSGVRDGHESVPATVKGVSLHDALARMHEVLLQHGSLGLRQALIRPESYALLEASRGCRDVNELLANLG